MARQWVAFLRGINVGKAKRVGMAELRNVVESLGYSDVRTVLATGNVVFTARRAGAPGARIVRAIEARLGWRSAVVALERREFLRVMEGNALVAPGRDPSRLVVGLVRGGAAARPSLSQLAAGTWAAEELSCGPGAVYLWCPDGLARSPLVAAVCTALGDDVTLRNWNTMLKIRAAMTGRGAE